jgi:histidine triad (HIT) family protein
MPCPFCEIVQGRAPADIVAYWDSALAILPLNPVTPGHTLIIPRKHVDDALTDPPLTGFLFQCAADLALDEDFRAAQQGPDWNLITSVGPAATQTVRHLHVHLVPRRPDDGLALPWTGQRKGKWREAARG